MARLMEVLPRFGDVRNRCFSLLVVLATLLMGCKGKAASVVEEYLNQPKCENRVNFVLEPDKYRAPLVAYYSDKTECVTEHGKVDASGCKATPVGEYCAVTVEKLDARYCVKRVAENDYKIDWPCSVGWNAVTAAQFKSTEQVVPVPFRAMVEMSDYTSSSFSAERFFVIRITDYTGSLYGVVRRESEAGRALYAKISQGGKHQAFLYLAHDAMNEDKLQEVQVVDVLAYDWKSTRAVDERLARHSAVEKTLVPCCNAIALTPIVFDTGWSSYARERTRKAFAISELTKKCINVIDDVVTGKKPPEAAFEELRKDKDAEFLPALCKPADAAMDPPEPTKPSCDVTKLGEPRMDMKPPEVTGNPTISVDEIKKVIDNAKPAIRSCYDAGRCNNNELNGNVALRFQIDQQGHATNVGNAGSDMPDPSVVNCITTVFGTLRFPAGNYGGVTVVSSTHLRPPR
jgi:hypothetical protein